MFRSSCSFRCKLIAAAGILAVGIVSVYLVHRYLSLRVTGNNMFPTLYPGSQVYADRDKRRELHRGDMIIYLSPVRENARRVIYIGRVIGLPEEAIIIRDGAVFAGQRKLAGLFASIKYESVGATNESTYNVPRDHLFILGDNPKASFDSRYWGMLPYSNVLGKVVMVDFPESPGENENKQQP